MKTLLLLVCVLAACTNHLAVGADSSPPPYPVFPQDFIGEVTFTDPRHLQSEPGTTWWLSVLGSVKGQRKIKQVQRFGKSETKFTYLIFDHAPNARPGSRSANHTVTIAEDGNLPPEYDIGPGRCEYSTYTYAWLTLPLGLGSVIGYGGFECDYEGGACVPTGLEYSGVVTLNDSRKAHKWNKTDQAMAGWPTYYELYTDVESNLPVMAHAWRNRKPQFFDISFNSLLHFDIKEEKPSPGTFAIHEGVHWPEICLDKDIGAPGFYVHPNRIFAANSTTDDSFSFVIGDKPKDNATHVAFFYMDSSYHTANCTSKNPCVSIIPDKLVFEPDNWGPQKVSLRFRHPGVMSFGFHVSGGGYNYTTGAGNSQLVYTCEHGHTGLDGCNM